MIEIVVVIAVLAVLGGIAVLVLSDSTEDSEVAVCQSELATVVAAIHAAKSSHLGGHGVSTPADHLNGTTRFYSWSGAAGAWYVTAIGPIPFGC